MTLAPADVGAPDVRAELMEMFRADQAERTGSGLPPGTKLPPSQDYSRAARLEEIIAENGWPTEAMVGSDGASAAWLVAQHADFDVEFQREVVALMGVAVTAGQADPTELAYLEDRVAVNSGEPQLYGTQIRCRAGKPDPATPLDDPDHVEERRAAVGLGTLDEYYAELALMCASEVEPIDTGVAGP